MGRLTYPNDSDSFQIVLETLWLLAGISSGHGVDSWIVTEDGKRSLVVLGGSESIYADLGVSCTYLMGVKNVKYRSELFAE